MCGGRVIRGRVAKAYGLDEAGGRGLKFLDFRTEDGEPADIEFERQQFCYALNLAVGDNQELKGTHTQ